MQHLDEGTIHAWLDGALPADESTGVERHVAQCKECASLVAEARGMIAGASRIVSALDVVPGGVIPKSSRAKSSSGSLWRALRLTPSRAALAATLVIAASTVLTLRHDTPTKIVPTMAAKAPAPVVSASPLPAAQVSEETRARQEVKVPPLPSAKADQPAERRREVADARTQTDSLQPAAKAKSSAAEVTTANSAVADRVIAAAPPAAPPVAAGAAAGGAVAAEARRSPAKVSVDSARVLAKVSADSARMEARAEPAGFAPRRLQTVPAVRDAAERRASDVTAAFSGCYQLTDSAAKDKSLPLRFALEVMRADPGANVVRAVSANGVPDTVIARASWQPLAQNQIDVRLPSAEKTLSLILRFPAGSNVGVATITGDGPARSVSVTRLTCR
jgi:hypothetical protein